MVKLRVDVAYIKNPTSASKAHRATMPQRFGIGWLHFLFFFFFFFEKSDFILFRTQGEANTLGNFPQEHLLIFFPKTCVKWLAQSSSSNGTEVLVTLTSQ